MSKHTKRFYISDLHLGHAAILKYERTQFSDLDEMFEHIETCWNSIVKPGDKVYLLGDVLWHKRELPKMDRLNGKKILIKGNHDNSISLKEYADYFEDIRGAVTQSFDGFGPMMLTHIPISDRQFKRYKANIHGHLHSHEYSDDPRYFNVSCEVLNYTPILAQDVVEILRKRLPETELSEFKD